MILFPVYKKKKRKRGEVLQKMRGFFAFFHKIC
jgi:hypothetical protein